MIKNYLKTAFRNIYKNRLFSGINVLGLGVGIAVFLVIFQYVSFESSYDKFHDEPDRIQRLILGRLDRGIGTSAKTAGVMAPILKENYSGIKSFVRLRKFPSLVSHEETRVHEDLFYFTDSSFFNVFSYQLLEGDKDNVLKEPNTIVLTETAAKRIFGKSNDLIGRFLEVDNRMTYRIDGIAKNSPANSHFQFEYLASTATIPNHYNEPLRTYQTNAWYAHYFYTFLELEEGVDPDRLGELIVDASKQLSDPELYELYGTNMGLYLQPISSIHLNPKYGEIEAQGDKNNLYILSSAGIIILLLAIVNFANLSTAQSIRRSREVALRKTLGAAKKQLMFQFFGESFITTFLAFLLAISFVQILQNELTTLVGISSGVFESFYQDNWTYMIALLLIVGFLGGAYPAASFSSFTIQHLFKDNVSGNRKLGFRKAVLLLQFTVSMVLISGTIVVFSQVDFMRSQELGIDTEQIVVLPTYGNSEIHDKYDRFRTRLINQPGIRASTLAELSPGDNAFGIIARFEGMEVNRSFTTTGVDYDYLKTYGLKLVAGRDFSREILSDEQERVIINRKLCQELGWSPDEAIGKTYDFGGDGITPGFVIGVVEDFHFNSLKTRIFPLVMAIAPNFYQKIAVKIEGTQLNEAIAEIEKSWSAVYPEWPFDYTLVDQDFEEQYQGDERFGDLFLLFTVLGLFIGALGIFGLIQLVTEYRRKELSIRKVLGAQIGMLARLLSAEYLKLMLLAFIVSAPIAYYLLSNWLMDFEYRIQVEWWMILASLVVVVLICATTIADRVYRAVVSNPVDSLRQE